MKTILILFTVLFISAGDLFPQVSQEWVKRFNSSGSNNDYVNAMTYDNNGNVYVTGGGGSNYITLKHSPDGAVLWQAVYGGPVNDADSPSSICVDAAGNVYVTGRSFGTGSGTDFATVKYDAAGNQLWVQRYNGSNNDDDAAVSVVTDAAGNVYAGGWSSSSNGSTDFTIVKYTASGSQVWVRHYNGTAGGNEFMNEMIIDGSGNFIRNRQKQGRFKR